MSEALFWRMEAERHSPNVTMRTCGWCETVHPENLSVEWTFGDRLYFCSDNCLREFGET